MALVKCKECGSEVSTSAKTCPHCGKRLQASGCSQLVLILFAIVLLVIFIPVIANNFTPKKVHTVVPAKMIPYEVVGGGGITSSSRIVISPDSFDEKSMTALGETLKYDCRNIGFARISIFDDMASATILTPQTMLNYANGSLDDHSLDHYYKHLIGQYEKNSSTGHHQFWILYDGMLGDNHKIIKY